jgi:putative ABC transport system permease protein
MAQQLGQTMLGIALDYRFDNAAVLMWLLLLWLLASLAAYWPARQAGRLAVVRCLAAS